VNETLIEGEIGGKGRSSPFPQGKRPIIGGKLARSTVRRTTSVYFEWSRGMETMATNYCPCSSAASESNTYYILHTFNVGLKDSRGLYCP